MSGICATVGRNSNVLKKRRMVAFTPENLEIQDQFKNRWKEMMFCLSSHDSGALCEAWNSRIEGAMKQSIPASSGRCARSTSDPQKKESYYKTRPFERGRHDKKWTYEWPHHFNPDPKEHSGATLNKEQIGYYKDYRAKWNST